MSSPKVGDVLTTVEQLGACPEGTIIRKSNTWILVRRNSGWYGTGGSLIYTHREVSNLGPMTVIWVPPVTLVEFEAVVRDFGWDEVVRPCVMRGDLDGGPQTDLAPLVGSRVRVTVEKIGNDHE